MRDLLDWRIWAIALAITFVVEFPAYLWACDTPLCIDLTDGKSISLKIKPSKITTIITFTF
jgi:hypothetical protein